ncbi:MAG: metal-dependent transcriptional regulator [Phycisphaerales bacterium]|nr:metal-dependent transcriptional regulator [Phycisphaerales bacterium]
MASSTVEDYLKQLYLLQEQSPEHLVAMGKLAALMGVVPGTATSMVKALADSGLVSYEPRGGVRLTAGGEQLALHVLRRHRLVELFLVKVLNLDWSVVHEEAEELEHSISDRVLERMDHVLGHPSVDPHGDPIPSSGGVVSDVSANSLADAPVGESLRVSRVIDQEPEFLQFIERCGLTPGISLVVESREAQADTVSVRIGRTTIALGRVAAQKILVESPADTVDR